MGRYSSFLGRLKTRFSWILFTTQQGADFPSMVKLFLGGVWFLVNDSWKSRLRFTAHIKRFGRVRPFQFADLGDYGLVREIFRSDTYNKTLPHDVNTIFDLGANVGVATLYFRLLYPDATIHSFEPDPKNVSRLRKNAELLGNAHVHEIAVWSSRTTLSFHADPHRGSSSSVYASRSRQEEIRVEACSLSEAIHVTGAETVDLLKFDVEGAEGEIFTSSAQLDRVRALSGEVHGDLCDAEAVLTTIKENFEDVEVVPMEIQGRWYVSASRALKQESAH